MPTSICSAHFPLRLHVSLPRAAQPPLLSDLKHELASITSIPYQQLKLVHQGLVLKDDRAPLPALGVREGSRIVLIGTPGGVQTGDRPGARASGAQAPGAQQAAGGQRRKKEEEEDNSEAGLLKRIKEAVEGVRRDLVPDTEQFEKDVQTLPSKDAAPAAAESANAPTAPAQGPTPATSAALTQSHRRLSEMLLRALLSLDAVAVNSEKTRASRKEAVREVQGWLDRLDAAWGLAKERGVVAGS